MIAELSTRITRQLCQLEKDLTERIPERLGAEPTQAAYAELVDRQRAIRERVEYLQRIATGLPIAGREALMPGQVGFGSRVLVEDLRTHELVAYTIMTGDGLDLDAGEISIASPVAQALQGRREGDIVEVVTPQRKRQLKVVSITTVFDIVGVPDNSGSAREDPRGPAPGLSRGRVTGERCSAK